MALQTYKLKKPIEYGGKLITEITYEADPAEFTADQMSEIKVDKDEVNTVGDITKIIAGITKQPIELIGSLKMIDWKILSNFVVEVFSEMGNLGNTDR